ncbi:MAG: 16S rRNA (cytosine(1402)-N(4))-methyltransferase RsmH [Phycisphaerae bacterium]|nr:16S rRNA (cytosine(1402)-N(4))-methyltransferase RsmH [Phycisphaerae bacterium]MDW8261920.1 16S rRNA (cytosine(1402)-N(4))-methyltransferase RsmH [Phycisphaerales bacterium]
MNLPPHGHDPVLLEQVVDALRLQADSVVVDCTVGRAGHAEAIARRLGTGGLLIALDVDPANLEYARRRLEPTPPAKRYFHANFAELEQVLRECGVSRVDALLADLGLSTSQFLDPAYGISFDQDAPLDMRLDPRNPLTAAQIVNRASEKELADLIYQLSDERFSRRIARKIVEARKLSPITSTRELAALVRAAVPKRGAGGAGERIDPATRTFMALRMKVNREPESLDRLLRTAPQHLRTGGRMAVISFHSLEDRAVKQAFRSAEQTGLLKVVTAKPIRPSESEIAANPRSRSARLRVAEKT